MGGICSKKLFGAGGIAAHLVKQAAYAMPVINILLVNIISLIGVFIGHFKGIGHQVFQLILSAYFLIAHVDLTIQGRKVYVDPVRVFRMLAKKGTVFGYLCVGRVFKGIRVPGLVKYPVLLLWKGDVEIASWLGCIALLAGGKKKYGNKKQVPHVTAVGIVENSRLAGGYTFVLANGHLYFLYAHFAYFQYGKVKAAVVNNAVLFRKFAGQL